MGKSLFFRKFLIPACAIAAAVACAGVAIAVEPPPSHTLDNRQKLAAFARRTRLQTPGNNALISKPIHITNENLTEYADTTSLTEVTEPGGGGFAATGAESYEENQTVGEDGPPDLLAAESDILRSQREFWRGRYLAAKENLFAAQTGLTALDEEISTLWQTFYSSDDPEYRDHDVRLQLESALRKRQGMETKIEELQAALPNVLSAAHADGALPGWFRDIK